MTKEEFNTRLRQIEYINRTIDSMVAFTNAWKKLSETWSIDYRNGIDLNDYLVQMYPFGQSFDELLTDVMLWHDDGVKKLTALKKSLQPNLADRNNLDHEA
jgi:hypothetical protein